MSSIFFPETESHELSAFYDVHPGHGECSCHPVGAWQPEQPIPCPNLVRRRTISGFGRYHPTLQSLPAREHGKLLRIARLIVHSHRPGCTPVHIVRLTGHANHDPERENAEPGFLRTISKERAINVQHALERLINAPAIVANIKWIVHGAGDRYPIVANPRTERQRAQNRRVDIRLSGALQPGVPGAPSMPSHFEPGFDGTLDIHGGQPAPPLAPEPVLRRRPVPLLVPSAPALVQPAPPLGQPAPPPAPEHRRRRRLAPPLAPPAAPMVPPTPPPASNGLRRRPAPPLGQPAPPLGQPAPPPAPESGPDLRPAPPFGNRHASSLNSEFLGEIPASSFPVGGKKYTNNPNEITTTTTTPTPQQVVDMLLSSWHELTPNGARTLTAQFMAETGGGKYCFNWNLGNVKSGPNTPHMYLRGVWEVDTPAGAQAQVAQANGLAHIATDEEVSKHRWGLPAGKVIVVFQPPHPQCRFRAYSSLQEGAERWLGHHQAIAKRDPSFLAALNAGDIAAVAHALKQARYYTAAESDYARAMVRTRAQIDQVLGPVS
jgi:hypothetical protein